MYDADEYLGFTFAGHHSSEFGLLVVSDGSRYHQNFSSAFNDTIANVPGYNGGYYFGTQIGLREFEINCAFDNITTHIRNKIQHWLYPNRVGWLIFDEAPYKKYLVKISQPINFSYLPFNNNSNNKNYIFEQDILKGEFSIMFFSFNEYGIGNEEYEIPIIEDNNINQQMVDSGLIPQNYNIDNERLFLPNIKKDLEGNKDFLIYNAGNGIAIADFYFDITKHNLKEGLDFLNYDDGQSYIIKDFSKEEKLKDYEKYRIIILGSKQEIWAYGISNDLVDDESKLNIGGYYNQYYPKIYHTKPTEVLIVTQTLNSDGDSEALFYPAILSQNYQSSDNLNNTYYFEEFKSKWSDYLICSKRRTSEINEVLNPSTLFVDLKGDNYKLSSDSLVYLIYPNKVSTDITNFTPIYENTYI